MEESGATAAAPPPLPPKTRRAAGCVTASSTPASAAAGVVSAAVGTAGATVLGGGAPSGGGSAGGVGAAQPLSSISTSGEHVVKIRINPDGGSAGSIRISVGSQDSTAEDMVRRPSADAFLKQPERNSPYFFCSSFPSTGMVISSGQSSPSDTLDSGTCSDLDGSTPPPLPKKNGVSAAAAAVAAAAAAAATVTVTVNGTHPQHRRTASLTSSGADADSDEDAGSNISCDSLNSHELNGGAELDDATHFAFSKIALSNGHHKHGETIMESIQEEKIVSPPSPTLKSVALTVRANNLVNNPMTAPVAPLVAATAATVTANNLSSAHVSNNSFSALNNSFGASNNSFGAPNNSFGTSNNSFGTSNNSFSASDSSYSAYSENSVSTAVNCTSTNVVTFNGPVVNSPASTNGVPKPPPPKTPAKPAKSIPSPPTPPKTPSSPTGRKTFLPQGLLQDIRDRTATLAGVSSAATVGTGSRKLRTWGEATPPKTPEPQSLSPEPKEYPKNQSSLYRILQASPSETDAPTKVAAASSGGIVKERTYEERTREAEAQNAAAAAAASVGTGRPRVGSYKYEEDRFYQFHLNEREPEPEDPRAARAAAEDEEEETFAGLKDIMGKKEGSATIRSAKGTVRGVKNRVRAGIATFLHYPDTKNYKEKEAGKVVLYVTTMGIVRHTFQECLKVKKILRTLLVKYEERDAFMSREVQNELRERMHSDQIMVPQLFIEGQHIGDAETIERLNETGELRKMLKPFKSPDVCNTCQVCGGFRLLPCSICNGSKKSMHRNDFTAEFVALKCMSCDEVGLVKCHAC